MKIIVNADDIGKLIEQGLKYIEFDHNGINFDLVIDIRKFLFNKSPEWYSEKFSKASG